MPPSCQERKEKNSRALRACGISSPSTSTTSRAGGGGGLRELSRFRSFRPRLAGLHAAAKARLVEGEVRLVRVVRTAAAGPRLRPEAALERARPVAALARRDPL